MLKRYFSSHAVLDKSATIAKIRAYYKKSSIIDCAYIVTTLNLGVVPVSLRKGYHTHHHANSTLLRLMIDTRSSRRLVTCA